MLNGQWQFFLSPYTGCAVFRHKVTLHIQLHNLIYTWLFHQHFLYYLMWHITDIYVTYMYHTNKPVIYTFNSIIAVWLQVAARIILLTA
jgi:hypothetical protein